MDRHLAGVGRSPEGAFQCSRSPYREPRGRRACRLALLAACCAAALASGGAAQPLGTKARVPVPDTPAALAAQVPNSAASAEPAAMTPELAAIDRFIEGQLRAQRVPGLALAISRGGEVLYVRGYGSAGGSRPVTPDTRFAVGSLSKGFTALAVMQLVEAGRVELDAPLREYLPEFTLADPAAAAEVTVRQLLNQTSGLADAGFPRQRSAQTLAERVTELAEARPVARPGREFNYFNPNYDLLARLVEAATGTPFGDYLEAHVFAPLGMVSTTSVLTGVELRRTAGLARGHLLAFGIPVPSAEEDGFLGGSGGVITTARDLARFLALQGNAGRYGGARLLSPAGVALMHTPPPDTEGGYAMGWFETTRLGTRVLEHNGILSTYYAEAVLLPDHGYGFVLLYDIHSLASDLLAYPRFKDGLIALLTGRAPRPGASSVGAWGVAWALLTVLLAGLALRSLLRAPGWAARACSLPLWRAVPGLVRPWVPAALLAALPALILATSGRAFGYLTLVRSMVGVVACLGLTAALGAATGVTRLVLRARCGGRARRGAC